MQGFGFLQHRAGRIQPSQPDIHSTRISQDAGKRQIVVPITKTRRAPRRSSSRPTGAPAGANTSIERLTPPAVSPREQSKVFLRVNAAKKILKERRTPSIPWEQTIFCPRMCMQSSGNRGGMSFAEGMEIPACRFPTCRSGLCAHARWEVPSEPAHRQPRQCSSHPY